RHEPGPDRFTGRPAAPHGRHGEPAGRASGAAGPRRCGAFESRAGQEVVLVARRAVTDGATRPTHFAQQTSLVETIAGTGYSALVAAMSHAVEDLADQIAAGIESRH